MSLHEEPRKCQCGHWPTKHLLSRLGSLLVVDGECLECGCHGFAEVDE